LKQADTPDVSGKRIADIEAKTNFLVRELQYNRQVQDALRGIRAVNQTLDQVEQARDERRILDALHLLEKSWTQLDQIPVSRSTRALKLLDMRAFELKNDVHGVFDHVWKALVHVDLANGSISVTESREGEHMSLTDAVIGLQAYKEVDDRMKDLWHDVDQAIFTPRMDSTNPSLPGIQVQDGVLQTAGTADKSINSLFKDLEQIFGYLVEKLPSALVASISSVMVPEVMTRITNVWLDSVVPSSLKDMDEFQQVITAAREFCRSLEALGLKGLGELQEWVDSAPRVWLSKCREAALDSVRSRLAEGLGSPKQVERVEKQMVSRMEGKELTVNTPAVMADGDDHGWGDAWSDGETKDEADASTQPPALEQQAAGEDDGTDAWGAWNEDDDAAEGAPEKPKEEHKDDEEDPADAWGWGDDGQVGDQEGAGAASNSTPSGKPQAAEEQATRELTLKETYYISSMPEPVLALIFALVEDGAALTQEHYENSPVAAAAAGLFSLPTLALAMFRAISPHYYASDIGGSM
jgi:centromere/kinetochore protein ZW10